MLKPPTTYDEQMEILKSRNIIISDPAFCLRILSNLNYYRLTAYMLPFKIEDNIYQNVSFEKVYYIYEFDRKLRNLLMTALEELELLLRTKLAYYHAHKFNPTAYLAETSFNKKHKHDAFINEFTTLVSKNKDNPFVKHHLDKYDGEFPIWVAVELFPFGMLSRFYADMIVKDKKLFAKEVFRIGYEHLESWLLCISTLRNRCAHYMRLYYFSFNKWPRPTKDSKLDVSNKIFDYINIIKHLYLDNDKWNNVFIAGLKALIDEYGDYIELEHIGFSENWEKILKKY